MGENEQSAVFALELIPCAVGKLLPCSVAMQRTLCWMSGGFQTLVELLIVHSPSIPAKDSRVCSEMESTAVFSLSPTEILWKDPGTSISPWGEMLEEQRGEPRSLAGQGDLVPAGGISLMSLGCANP